MIDGRRGAIIGFGFIAERGHLPAYREQANLSIDAVADGCAARRALAKRLLPTARIYEDAYALLEAERALDFVDIATPPRDHAPLACAALERGLHVLCEKPLAASLREGEAMLHAAERARRVLFPVHNYKHAPSMRAVRQLLDSGRLGAVHLVTLDTFRTQHARGVEEWLPDWRRIRGYAGGGIAMDHGAHTFYLALEWLGAAPLSISATMSSRGAHDTEDCFSATITFPTGVALARLTWTGAVRKVIYTIHGEHGAIRLEDDDLEVAIRGEPPCRRSIASQWSDASHTSWFGAVLDGFAAAIVQRDWASAEARDALTCLRLIETGYASARGGGGALSLSAAPSLAIAHV